MKKTWIFKIKIILFWDEKNAAVEIVKQKRDQPRLIGASEQSASSSHLRVSELDAEELNISLIYDTAVELN